MNKKFYLSKTLWVNVLAIVGIIIYGKELPTETIAMVLGIINFLLRLITKNPVEW